MINLSPEMIAIIGGFLTTGFFILRGNIWKKKAKENESKANSAEAQNDAHEVSRDEEAKTKIKIQLNKDKVNSFQKISDVFAHHFKRVREVKARFRKDSDSK